MQRYETYKDSGVEWIGEIPDRWEVKKLKYGVSVNPSKGGIDKDSDEMAVFLPMEKVSEDGEIDCSIKKPISDLYNGFTFFRKNDVIVAKITPCFENGKGALLNELETDIGFGSTEFHVLRAKPEICKQFLYYITKSETFMKVGEAFMSGAAGQKRVPTDFISNFPLASPNIEEQTAIANYLDRKTAEIDALIAQKQRLIELYQEEKTAIINQAVTKGIDPNAKLKDSGIDWLGEIPVGWEVKKLKHVAILKSGNNLTSENINNGKYPVYGGNGLRGYYDKFTHDGGLVLIGRQGALCGNINYAKGKFWATDHAVVVQPRLNYRNIWLGEMLRAMNLNQYSVAAAQPGLAVEAICNLSVPYPSIEEQTAIVQHIETETARIDAKIAKTQRIIELQKEYRTALISEVVTGKIKVSHLAEKEITL